MLAKPSPAGPYAVDRADFVRPSQKTQRPAGRRVSQPATKPTGGIWLEGAAYGQRLDEFYRISGRVGRPPHPSDQGIRESRIRATTAGAGVAASFYRSFYRVSKVRIRRLWAHHLEALYDRMLHPTDNRRPLAPKTVLEVHLVIRGALNHAVTRGLVNRNVALVAHAPKLKAIPKVEP